MAAGRPQLARDRLARQDSKLVGMGGLYTLEKEERKAGHTFYVQGRYFSRQRGFQCASTTKILTTLNSRKKCFGIKKKALPMIVRQR